MTLVSSTIRYESRTTIDRPVEDVFARLADLPAYSTWMHRAGLFRRCRQISDGPIEMGTSYLDATRMGTYRGEVTEFERPSRIGFREADQERTVVHHVAEGELFGWMRLMKPAAALMARSERARTLKSLKRSLESD
jgi:uncharacterized protein YndB with AHSA1/START domain